MTEGNAPLYDDGSISCEVDASVIGRYYPWGSTRIPYRSIRGVMRLPLTGASWRWRIWGSGDFVHWWNLDRHRRQKQSALVIDLGRHWLPTITPRDPETVERIVTERLSG